MTGRTADTILLGVGEDQCEAAVAYVVAEVARRGGQVRVAHAILPLERATVPPPLTVAGDTMRVVGGRILDEVARRLEHELPDVPIVTALLHGPASKALVKSSHAARLVVLQRHRRTRTHVRTLAVTGNVAAHAVGPVVVVPAEWHPDPDRGSLVVVGVDDVLTSPQLLSTALGEAAAREGRLRIVHAWFYSDLYDDIAFAGPAAAVHEDELRHDLTRELAPTLAKHHEVPVELVVTHGRPADVLVAESRAAGLVVVGRHRASVPWGSHLGSVVRGVLRESVSPVMVLDSAPERSTGQISSEVIEIAPAGHSAAQMPQPLQ